MCWISSVTFPFSHRLTCHIFWKTGPKFQCIEKLPHKCYVTVKLSTLFKSFKASIVFDKAVHMKSDERGAVILDNYIESAKLSLADSRAAHRLLKRSKRSKQRLQRKLAKKSAELCTKVEAKNLKIKQFGDTNTTNHELLKELVLV